MYTAVDDIFRISVRNLVEFMCASGDIDNRDVSVPDVRVMQEGARIHRKIQHSMGSSYHAEVLLRQEIPLTSDKGFDYVLKLEGRADGIIADIDEDDDGNRIPVSDVTIDEIKTMQADVTKLKEPVYVHKAQALVYGYIYLNRYKLEHINIQMTYCNPETEKIVRFTEEYDKNRINSWFEKLVDGFKRWMDYVFDERIIRNESIHKLSFPFEYRAGQKNLVASVYKTIESGQKLYIQAPTGVGKTISTVYPSVQACGRGLADKIFYLTSKTITRTVAEETYSILRDKGLHFTTVTLTAKDKICHMDERNCNPDVCEYAKGHFDRINDAVYDIITHESVIDREKVLEYSVKHKVCPFEMSLDATYWVDGIICDYNYVFDPDVYLKRYFSDGSSGDYIFLIDEAHNLVDRARDMYSASLCKEAFLKVRRLVEKVDKRLASALARCNKNFLELKKICDDVIVLDSIGAVTMALNSLFEEFTRFFEEKPEFEYSEEASELFFEVRHFLNMYDLIQDNYVIYGEHTDDGFMVKLFCVNPSPCLAGRLEKGKAAVFFSATLLPVTYYKELLSKKDDYAIYIKSPFDSANRLLAVGYDVTSRYTRRNETEFLKIKSYIADITAQKKGNYMVFFPSYGYMDSVYKLYTEEERRNIIVQNRGMTEVEREQFLDRFRGTAASVTGEKSVTENTDCGEADLVDDCAIRKENNSEETSERDCIGFCVTGGVFSEGIDLKNESLIGCIIVGTGIPQICTERRLLKDYYDEKDGNGYNYAYTYPGMNKVLQAAGRVIRTMDDVGVIVLLDERFARSEYVRLFPAEWADYKLCNLKEAPKLVAEFWDGHS